MDSSPARRERHATGVAIVAVLLLAIDVVARIFGVDTPTGLGEPLHNPELRDFLFEALTEGATFVAALFVTVCGIQRTGVNLAPEQLQQIVREVTGNVAVHVQRESPPPAPPQELQDIHIEPITDEVTRSRKWT